MNEYSNPKQVHPPLGAYSHTVKVPPNATWLILSGQVGINASGKLQTGVPSPAFNGLVHLHSSRDPSPRYARGVSKSAHTLGSLDLHRLGDWTDDACDLVVFPHEAYAENARAHDYTRKVLNPHPTKRRHGPGPVRRAHPAYRHIREGRAVVPYR